MPWGRASELDRILLCPGPAVLPHLESALPAAVESRAWGKMVHRWAATGRVEADPGFPGHARLFSERLQRSRVHREVLWPAGGNHEVAVAVRTSRAGRASGLSLERDPEAVKRWKEGQSDDWVVGEVDYLHEDWLGAPWVDDLKTGRREYLAPVRSAQYATYALAAMRAAGALHPAEHVRTTRTHWPRYPAGWPPRRSPPTNFTRDDLDGFERALIRTRDLVLRLRDAVTAGLPDPAAHLRPGEHCTFCPSRAACPMEKPEIKWTTAKRTSP